MLPTVSLEVTLTSKTSGDSAMSEFSADCLSVLELLRDRHNVLVSGAPGTGKSRLLTEVARAFASVPAPGPVHVPGQRVPIPAVPPAVGTLRVAMPSPACNERRVFRTAFHQGTKHREFLTGLIPIAGNANQGAGTSFKIAAGTLYRASEHARQASSAALLVIDEINRGPAVQVFGASIVAIESDKRLLPNGSVGPDTQHFELMSPPDGEPVEYALPHHLYLLAAMNQADTSVEPLDVAFLRRWVPYRLQPNLGVLRHHFGLGPTAKGALPDRPASASDVYAAAVHAWQAVNARIEVGRGPEFELGHGVLMTSEPPGDLAGALHYVSEAWRVIRVHIDEVFFGDSRGVAAVMNVADGVAGHVYTLEGRSFADEPRLTLRGPDPVPVEDVYRLLRAVALD